MRDDDEIIANYCTVKNPDEKPRNKAKETRDGQAAAHNEDCKDRQRKGDNAEDSIAHGFQTGKDVVTKCAEEASVEGINPSEVSVNVCDKNAGQIELNGGNRVGDSKEADNKTLADGLMEANEEKEPSYNIQANDEVGKIDRMEANQCLDGKIEDSHQMEAHNQTKTDMALDGLINSHISPKSCLKNMTKSHNTLETKPTDNKTCLSAVMCENVAANGERSHASMTDNEGAVVSKSVRTEDCIDSKVMIQLQTES